MLRSANLRHYAVLARRGGATHRSPESAIVRCSRQTALRFGGARTDEYRKGGPHPTIRSRIERFILKRPLLVMALIVSCASQCLATGNDGSATPAAYRQQIGEVLETFRTSIITKNGAALRRLSLGDDVPLVPVDDDRASAASRKGHRSAKRARPFTYKGFVNFVVSSKDRNEETFSNVQIRTDGLVASVYFDYTFRVNGSLTNWGHETWGLAKTDTGWKISSICWSVST